MRVATPMPTPGSVTAALVLGAATGGLGTGVVFALAMTISAPSIPSIVGAPLAVLFIAIWAIPIWLIGLLTIGGPAWLALHRVGMCSTRMAEASGFGLVLLVCALFLNLSHGLTSWSAWSLVLGLSLTGAATGRVAAFVGYGASARTTRPTMDLDQREVAQ
jgi:hypothetical protein